MEEALAKLPRLQEEARRSELEERCRGEIAALRAAARQVSSQLAQKRRELQRVLSGSLGVGGSLVGRGCLRSECRGKMIFDGVTTKCGVCSAVYCNECHAALSLEGDHSCVSEDLDTVRLLRENTRACPVCHEGIFKESGCDQMFCTRCRTAFSWRTGEVVRRGPIHNPHFLEEQPGLRVPGDVPCGGLPNYMEVFVCGERAMRGVFVLAEKLVTELMPRLHRSIQRRPQRERALCVRYLRGQVNATRWRTLLHRERLREEKHRRYHQVLDTLSTGLVERLRASVASGAFKGDAAVLVEECRALLEVANAELHKMRSQYGGGFPPLAFTEWGI